MVDIHSTQGYPQSCRSSNTRLRIIFHSPSGNYSVLLAPHSVQAVPRTQLKVPDSTSAGDTLPPFYSSEIVSRLLHSRNAYTRTAECASSVVCSDQFSARLTYVLVSYSLNFVVDYKDSAQSGLWASRTSQAPCNTCSRRTLPMKHTNTHFRSTVHALFPLHSYSR